VAVRGLYERLLERTLKVGAGFVKVRRVACWRLHGGSEGPKDDSVMRRVRRRVRRFVVIWVLINVKDIGELLILKARDMGVGG